MVVFMKNYITEDNTAAFIIHILKSDEFVYTFIFCDLDSNKKKV